MKKQAEWIWYNGDYEIRQLNTCLTSRYEREVFVPPFWHIDDFCKNVKFIKSFTLEKKERIRILANGLFNVIVDKADDPKNCYVRNFPGYVDLEKGDYKLTVSVYNETEIPAIYVEGETVCSGPDFLVTSNDFHYLPAGFDGLTDPESPPGKFRFSYRQVDHDVIWKRGNELFLDCKKEMMGLVCLEDCEGAGTVEIWYGESREEALDKENCELTDVLHLPEKTRPTVSKAFRYLLLRGEKTDLSKVKVLCEYHPQERTSHFTCSDARLEKIYSISLDTLALNTRDFFLDGIKRDRWLWAGDAYQAFLMNYYSFFDLKTARRTMVALAGKPPVVHFMNHIMEYSFYWIIGLYDYYMYTGDAAFINRMLPTAKRIIEFSHTRKSEDGLLEGKEGDWVFVDWANLDNRGEVSAENIIYLKALDTVAKCCKLLGEDAEPYEKEYEQMRQKVFDVFWDKERGVFYYSRVDGKYNTDIKRHPHIFALYFGLLDDEQQNAVIKNVLLNDKVEKIVTPFMRFFELSALCVAGETQLVYDEILSYWGGMVDEGATSFWELYDKDCKGVEKYAMYGRKYGKSLCHAWGASPLYLLGRYLIGLRPVQPGYKEYEICPRMYSPEEFSVTLPLNCGDIEISYSQNAFRVYAEGADGILRLDRKIYETDEADAVTDGEFVFRLKAGVARTVAVRKKQEGSKYGTDSRAC